MRLDLMMLNPIDRLIVADAPGWRSDRGSELNAPPIQQILAECGSADGEAASQYVALLVPYAGGKSPVLSARLLENDMKTGTVAVEVQLADRTDMIVSSLDSESHQIDSLVTDGQFGFVSRNSSGEPKRAYLLAGTRLHCGDVDLALDAATTHLKVESVEGRTFHLVDVLPSGLIEVGGYVLAGGTGYEIESAEGRTITVRDYPVMETGEITLLHAALTGLE